MIQGGSMTRLKANLAMSLDGYVAGPEQGAENPLGKGGMELHQWMFELAAFQDAHDGEGGIVNASSTVVEEMQQNVGAVIMGRNMFGPIRGPWQDESWRGWWGEDPPFHTPVFVLTHHAREPIEMQGGTTFHFVTDGIESAYTQARAAAGGTDITLAGGASTVQQAIRAGLLDELQINLVPILLGGGERLLDGLGGAPVGFELTRVMEAPGVTHLRYRMTRKDGDDR
jgi:dihydrofolate reductase